MKTSAITLGRFDVAAIMLFYGIYMLIWLFAGLPPAAGAIKLIVFVLMSAQIIWHWQLIRHRSREGCFKAFRLNHWLGFTLFIGIAVAAAWK